MNIINIEHLTHSFTERLLFDDVSFYLSDKDKVGVIGINGTGKSTLLKIIAGKETADRADIIMQRDLRIAYLPQDPENCRHTYDSFRCASAHRRDQRSAGKLYSTGKVHAASARLYKI